MKGNRTETEHKRGSLAKRLLGWARVQAGRLGKALLDSGGLVSVLRLVIVMELCMLGVGVVRRLETSYEMAEETAKLQLAIAEAQMIERGNEGRSVLNIGAVGTSDDGDETTDDAPGQRPRDVPTIISETLGDADTAVKMLEAGQGLGAGELPVAQPEDDVLDVPGLSPETREEVDMLIRRGVAAMTAGDMRKCVLSLEQAYAMAPSHPALLYYYGMAYDKLLNPAKAKEYYDKVFRMRNQAGKFFQRASRRLAYGMEQPTAMRGKLAFGPYKVRHVQGEEQGEKVSILLPIMLAPGEEIRSDDVYIRVQIFEIVNGRKVVFSREQPKYEWVNEKQTWENCEEDLIVSYEAPALTAEELSAGDAKYYGFTAVLAYKGEPLDLISTPAALILHEQQLSNPRRGGSAPGGLLPDDGLSPYVEEATPFSDEFGEETQNYL